MALTGWTTAPGTRRAALVLALAWVLWAQTRTSGPAEPIADAWDVIDTFPTRARCEAARAAIEPPPKAGPAPPPRPFTGTRYVCFPDTLDPRTTP